MFQILIKIVAISTKNFFLESILYGGNHTPNSLNIMYSTHTGSLIWHKGYYCFQVINTRIMIILVLDAGIVTRPQNPSW
jgi:hypothetical protein